MACFSPAADLKINDLSARRVGTGRVQCVYALCTPEMTQKGEG